MKYLFLLLFVPLAGHAGNNDAAIPDYYKIHKPYLSIRCIDENTQQAMDQCADKSLAKAKSQMKFLLDRLKKNHRFEEPVLFKLMQVSHNNWQIYMNSSCKVETYYSRSGSGFNSIWNVCLEVKINERISYLRWLMENP